MVLNQADVNGENKMSWILRMETLTAPALLLLQAMSVVWLARVRVSSSGAENVLPTNGRADAQ